MHLSQSSKTEWKDSLHLRYHNGSQAHDKPRCALELAEKCDKDAVFYEIEPEKLYLIVVSKSDKVPDFLHNRRLEDHLKGESTKFNYFNLDEHNDFYYESFHRDFGPYNLATTHLFLSWMKIFFDTARVRSDNVVVIVTSDEPETRLNATYLVAIAALVLLKKSPKAILESLQDYMFNGYWLDSPPSIATSLVKFLDVSGSSSKYHMSLEHCLEAWEKALEQNFYDYYEFDHAEYRFCEQVQCGDLNWIVPNKIMAFCGPYAESTITEFTHRHRPEFYYHYFKDYNVTTIIRLNEKEYDSSSFKKLGFDHHDLIFNDGYSPRPSICKKFINIVDNAEGAVAIHCAAGLGRTGTLIGAYLVARYGFEAESAIAWIRICRPGSVIANQQDWLVEYSDHIKTELRFTAGSRKTKNSRKSQTDKPKSDSQDTTKLLEDDKITVFSLTNAKHGQAKGLLKAKSQREKEKRSREESRPTKSHLNNSHKIIATDSKSVISRQSKSALDMEPLDLGKTLPFMFRLKDFAECEHALDIETYEISEMPLSDMQNEPSDYHTWKIKYPKNTYFSLSLLSKNLMTIKKRKRVPLYINQFALPIYKWCAGKCIAAFNDAYGDDFKGCDKEVEKSTPLPGQGGIIFFKIFKEEDKMPCLGSPVIYDSDKNPTFNN